MDEFLAGCASALPGVVVSALISGVVLYYLRKYIDQKLEEEEQHRKKETQLRTQPRSPLPAGQARGKGSVETRHHGPRGGAGSYNAASAAGTTATDARMWPLPARSHSPQGEAAGPD